MVFVCLFVCLFCFHSVLGTESLFQNLDLRFLIEVYEAKTAFLLIQFYPFKAPTQNVNLGKSCVAQ